MRTDPAGASLLENGPGWEAVTIRLGITGHQSVPASARSLLHRVLDELITSSSVGVSSLAAGADQEFARAVLRAGGSLITVIPARDYSMTFSNAADLATYRELLAASDQLIQLSYERSSEKAFMAAGRRVVDECELLIAVWDGEPAHGLGGTGDVVEYARKIGRPLRMVWPPGVSR
jgi:hypothetical protein